LLARIGLAVPARLTSTPLPLSSRAKPMCMSNGHFTMKYRLSSWITPGQRLALLACALLVWRRLTRSGGSYRTAPLSLVRNQPTVMGPEAGPSFGPFDRDVEIHD
jgi:hypothetical protein